MFTFSLFLTPFTCFPEFCSARVQSKSALTLWMAVGRANFIKGTNIKSKQFTRTATCVRICREINKLFFLDHWSLNALLIWEKKSKVLWKLCVYVHACSHQRKRREG